MLTRCRMCGKIVFGWGREKQACPQCGSVPSEGASPTVSKSGGTFGFPPRQNSSLEDDLDRQKQESLENKAVGESRIFADWTDISKKRPLDVPYYTALKGRACMLIVVSNQSIPNAGLIETVLNSRRPLALQVEAFLRGSFPILRCNFMFPDNPADPLILEAPLNVTDGNVQDFCAAIVDDETIDILLTHEQLGGKMYAVAVRAVGLADALKREVKRVLADLKPSATAQSFQESVKTMESVFPSGSAGVVAQKCIKLNIAGEARHKIIEY